MKLRIAAPARRDIANILAWSGAQFGLEARQRYESLIAAALKRIASEREPLAAKPVAELDARLRLLHLRHVPPDGKGVRNPRHFIAFRAEGRNLIVVLRVLHDAMDLPAHLKEAEPK